MSRLGFRKPGIGVGIRAAGKGIVVGAAILVAGTVIGACWFLLAAPGNYVITRYTTLLLVASFIAGGFTAGAAGSGRYGGAAITASTGVGLGLLSMLFAGQFVPETVTPGGVLFRLFQAAVWAALGGYLAARVPGRRRKQGRIPVQPDRQH